MDHFCAFLRRVISWVEYAGPPRIPFVGKWQGNRCINPPAPHIEIACLLDGHLPNMRIGDKEVLFPSGHISLHGVHLGNASSSTAQLASCWCLFLDVKDDSAFSDIEHHPLFCVAPLADMGPIEIAFARLSSRCSQYGKREARYLCRDYHFDPLRDGHAKPAARLYIQAAVLDLLATILDGVSHPMGEPEAVMPSTVRRVLEFINSAYSNPRLDLSAMSTTAGLEVNHFGRLFRCSTGRTPMQYLKEVRMSRARFLLMHSDQSVESVASACGFQDQFHFSRVFRRQIGMSPSRYRRERQLTASGEADLVK